MKRLRLHRERRRHDCWQDGDRLLVMFGEREGVLLRDGIQVTVIDGPTYLLAILLRDLNLLPQGLFHDRVQWSMFHLDRGGSWLDSHCVREDVSLTVAPDRDYVGVLEEGPDDLIL